MYQRRPYSTKATVTEAGRTATSVIYSVNAFDPSNLAFDTYTDDELRGVINQPDGHTIQRGGCAQWTAEQFIQGIQATLNLRRSWKNVMATKNFISDAINARQ